MNRKKTFFTFCLAVAALLATTAPSQAITAKKILKKVDKKYEDLSDFRAAFSQTIFVDSTDSGYSTAGTLWVKKPDRFRLELERQTMISDGDTLWTYVPMHQQVLVDRVYPESAATRPDQLFLKYFKEADAELMDTVELDGHECYLLHLTPEEPDVAVFLKVWVDGKSWLARRLEVTDDGGLVTEYEFTDVQINLGLVDSLFVYRPPPEVEVIDMRW
jgi:outer membrane lipoprotein carrier protein